jgi:hypothetical protein
MVTPERFDILQKAFNRAKCSGLHEHVQPPPISFASELVGLIARKDASTSRPIRVKKQRLFRADTPLPYHCLIKVGLSH